MSDSEDKSPRIRHTLTLFAIALAILGGLLVLFYTRYIVLAALIGIGFGVLIAPLMNLLLERYRIPRAVSAVLLVILILGGLFGASYGIFVLVRDQVILLIDRAPQIAAAVQDQITQIVAGQAWVGEQIGQLDLASYARTVIQALFAGLTTTVTAVAGAFVVLTIGLYTAINSRRYFAGFLSLFPGYMRPKTTEVLARSASVLRQWFRSQLIVMRITALATSLGLWVLGIDYWLLLGLLTGVFGFIPFIGAFLTGFLTIIVTLGSNPEQVWWVIALYIGIQQLEGDVTIPLVMRGSIQLPEVHLIILMLIMGSLFGLIGVFLAPPLLAVGRCIYLMTYVPKMNQMNRRDRSAPAVLSGGKPPGNGVPVGAGLVQT